MVHQVHPWHVADGELTLELIHTLHFLAGHFRIRRRRYDAGTQFESSSRAKRFYLLAGVCEYTVADSTWKITAPCFVDLPAGEFRFCASNDFDVSLVHVWELPLDFWQDNV